MNSTFEGEMQAGSERSYVFGPVPSRRLGRSLGLDIVPFKTCSFDCVYCQLGRTTQQTTRRRDYVSLERVVQQLRARLAQGPELDYVTLSGSGEPTLHSGLGHLIAEAKVWADVPVAVLTNGSLFSDPQVRSEIRAADLIVPSLDAATPLTFASVNRPCPELRVGAMIQGLQQLRAEFDGQIWLEIMFVRGMNDSSEEIQALQQAVASIQPDRVQLNTVVRPPAEGFARPLDPARLERIAAAFTPPAEVIAELPREVRERPAHHDLEQQILMLLSRRPCTLEDLSKVCQLHPNETLKYLNSLLRDQVVREIRHEEQRFFAAQGEAPPDPGCLH